jgi:hypothetical protein
MNRPIIHAPDDISIDNHGAMTFDRVKPRTWRKICPNVIVSTTNHTWSDQGANPGLCGDRPVTDYLNQQQWPYPRTKTT